MRSLKTYLEAGQWSIEDLAKGPISKTLKPSNKQPEQLNKLSGNLFNQMMKEIDAELVELGRIITIQAALATRNHNEPIPTAASLLQRLKARTQIPQNPPIQQNNPAAFYVPEAYQRFNSGFRGFIAKLWNNKNENKSLEWYNQIDECVCETTNNMLSLNEALLPLADATKQALDQFRGKISNILKKYFLQFDSHLQMYGNQPQQDMQSIVDKFHETLKKYFEHATSSQNAIKELVISDLNKRLAEKARKATQEIEKNNAEMLELKKRIEQLDEEYKSLQKASNSQINNLEGRVAEIIKESDKLSKVLVARTAKAEKAHDELVRRVKNAVHYKNTNEPQQEEPDYEKVSDQWFADNFPSEGNFKKRQEMQTVWFDNHTMKITAQYIDNAREFMKENNLNPCDIKDVKLVWPHHSDDLTDLCQKDVKAENYSSYLAGKILEGSNIDAKKKYFKYLLEYGI